jgi:DNA-binding CsgD family transcriptional regulator
MWLPMMYLLCDAVRRLDNATWARELYDLLLPYADRYTVNSNTVCYGSVELALGSVAATMREPVAEAHLRRAIERNGSIDAPVFVARARERLGALLVELGRRDEAIDELQRAGEAYSRFDLSVAAQRVADLMPEEASAEPVSSMGSLTAREVEVLRLLAGGASNKEIADRLYLSLRTVERHITNLYAKIEARGKADATAYALRHGLLS